jgi:hypothetical protein
MPGKTSFLPELAIGLKNSPPDGKGISFRGKAPESRRPRRTFSYAAGRRDDGQRGI